MCAFPGTGTPSESPPSADSGDMGEMGSVFTNLDVQLPTFKFPPISNNYYKRICSEKGTHEHTSA